MSEDVYRRVARILDTLPNGFPATDSGVELKILKKIFTPEEAELFCDLRLTPETAEQIAARTGRPLEGLDEKYWAMQDRGELFGFELEGKRYYKLVPWVVGLYEFQLHRMDREFAELVKEYNPHFGAQFVTAGPAVMQVLPIEKKIPIHQEALTYNKVSHLIETNASYAVMECICKKEQGLLDNPCSKPTEVCMALAPIPGVFDNYGRGRSLTKEQAYEVLDTAEKAGLVHLTGNVQNGQWFICNCCGCCCGVLEAVKTFGPLAGAVNSAWVAQIDPDECTACGTCLEERCQVAAIEEDGEVYRVKPEQCIGCGLCLTTCPVEAISLVKKPETITPPVNDDAWLEEKAGIRGVDYSALK